MFRVAFVRFKNHSYSPPHRLAPHQSNSSSGQLIVTVLRVIAFHSRTPASEQIKRSLRS